MCRSSFVVIALRCVILQLAKGIPPNQLSRFSGLQNSIKKNEKFTSPRYMIRMTRNRSYQLLEHQDISNPSHKAIPRPLTESALFTVHWRVRTFDSTSVVEPYLYIQSSIALTSRRVSSSLLSSIRLLFRIRVTPKPGLAIPLLSRVRRLTPSQWCQGACW